MNPPTLLLVTEPSARLPEIVAESLAGGVNVVQLRDKGGMPDCLHETATLLRFLTGEAGATLLVNGDTSVARAIGADGVHLAERERLSVAEARAALGSGALVGRSVHGMDAARSAAREGADYVIAGTIFASRSHPEAAGLGLEFLRAVCAVVRPLPVLAIGGITPERVRGCLDAGAAGVAVLSPILWADDPRAAARAFRQELDTWSN